MATAKRNDNELQNVSQKLSDLVQAYINAGTQIASGLTKVVADSVQDLSETYCGEMSTKKDKQDDEGHVANVSGVCSRMVDRATDQINAVCEPFADVCKADSLDEAADRAADAAQEAEVRSDVAEKVSDKTKRKT